MIDATSSESLLATLVPSVDDPVPGNHLKRRLVIHPHRGFRRRRGHCRLVGPLRLLRGEAPPVEPLRLLGDEMRLGEPLRLLGGLPPAEPLRLRGELTPRGLLIQEKGRLGTPSLPGEAPLLQRDNVVRRERLSLPQCNAPHGPHPGNHHRRDQDHGLLMARLLLQERKKKLKTPQFRPQSRLWLTLLSPTSRTLSPRRLRSPPGLLTCRFRLVSLTQRLLRDLSWAGPRLCQTPLPKPKRNSPKRIQEGRACHTLLPSVNRLEKVSNSPSQGKELIANPDVLDLLRNKVPDFRLLPISVKEGVALERTLRSVLESQSFLTWSVMGILKSLHLKSLLPKEDPVLSQLQKSFSKATNNIASALTSSTAFLTLKRRQLLLSHVVPSVSEAQKRNLLADPFFQTSSLFDASSLESARSAARDMSLFKPHLKASTSSSQGRRQGPSTSSHRRGAARQYSGASSSQRASSPPRQQSFKKGEARFHKKSSGTPQKRGGFRK